jgi:hypothetical protein
MLGSVPYGCPSIFLRCRALYPAVAVVLPHQTPPGFYSSGLRQSRIPSMNRIGEKFLEIMEREGVRDVPDLVDRINETREHYNLPIPEVTVEEMAAYMTAPEDERPELQTLFFLALELALGWSREQSVRFLDELSQAMWAGPGGAFDDAEPPQP